MLVGSLGPFAFQKHMLQLAGANFYGEVAKGKILFFSVVSPVYSVPGSKVKSCLAIGNTSSALSKSVHESISQYLIVVCMCVYVCNHILPYN